MSVTGTDLAQKSILHLHAAAQSLLPVSQAVSSHLGSRVLFDATENDINLPQTYVETRLCQRCGTIYVPGVTCVVRNIQSRRQRRKARNLTWVVYECKVCSGTFRTEVDVPLRKAKAQDHPPHSERMEVQRKEGNTQRKEANKTVEPPVLESRSSKRKRGRIQGLKSAIEKSKAEKSTRQLTLADLMKVD
jgi:RNase P subunit RPR2